MNVMPQAFRQPLARAFGRGDGTTAVAKTARRRLRQGIASFKFAVNRSPQRGVVFHHIPKCAGSSVGSAIFQNYPPWQYGEVSAVSTVEAVRFFSDGTAAGSNAILDAADPLWAAIHHHRLHLLYTLLASGTKAVRGHVVYHADLHRQFAQSHVFVTILRDPIERFVSQYFFNKHVHTYARLAPDFGTADLERIGPLWGSTITLYLSGGPRHGRFALDGDRDHRVAEAKRAVEAMDAVGFIDRMPLFQRRLAAVGGVRIEIGRRNVRPPRNDSDEERWIRDAAPRFCAPDLEVYDHARTIWTGRG